MQSQKNIQDTLTHLADKDRLSHAYLFFGPPQTGKHAFALSLARCLEHNTSQKTKPSHRPLTDTLQIPNPNLEVEPLNIGIKEIRHIKKFLSQGPLISKRRTVVIDNAENITWQAAPALLKIVEEPPKHALMILVTHDPQTLHPALLSRLTKIYFPTISKNKIKEVLMKEHKVSKEKAEKISKESFGRINRALKLAKLDNTETKNQKSEEIPLAQEIEKGIINLYLKDPKKNAKKIAFLLCKEEASKRFNLNPKLQRKAIEHTLNL